MSPCFHIEGVTCDACRSAREAISEYLMTVVPVAGLAVVYEENCALKSEIESLRRDRDEWKEQHERVLVLYQAEVQKSAELREAFHDASRLRSEIQKCRCAAEDRLREVQADNDSTNRKVADLTTLADERLAYAHQIQTDFDAEWNGRMRLRRLFDARDDETMGQWLDRLEAERADAAVPAEVHERGWQWRPTDPDTAFAPPFGTIRVCRACGCLVAGGPTCCGRCAAAEVAKP